MKRLVDCLIVICALFLFSTSYAVANPRPGRTVSFNDGWRFHLGDVGSGQNLELDDSQWRLLNLPHDCSIDGECNEKNPSTPGGGALPGVVGWYRKSFTLPTAAKGKLAFVDFDGVYRNSEVWINGHYLGKRPYGYISFQYELSPYVNYGPQKNIIAVKVDNSQQPNSRWYSGSGIYRNVWLTTIEKVHVDHWGTYDTTPEVSEQSSTVAIKTQVRNGSDSSAPVNLTTIIYDAEERPVGRAVGRNVAAKGSNAEVSQTIRVSRPMLWSDGRPYLYKVGSQLQQNGRIVDRYEKPL